MTQIVTADHFQTLRIDKRITALTEAKAGREFAVKSISVVLAAYRSSLIDDPKTFMRLAVAALEDVPSIILDDMASPRVGIIRECTFPPSVAELVKWCERRKRDRLLSDGSFRDEGEFQDFWSAYSRREPWAVEFAKTSFAKGGRK